MRIDSIEFVVLLIVFIVTMFFLFANKRQRYFLLNDDDKCKKGVHCWDSKNKPKKNTEENVLEEIICNNCGAEAEEKIIYTIDGGTYIHITKKGKFNK